jgi:DNA-binding NarL/FixJ family response regulator
VTVTATTQVVVPLTVAVMARDPITAEGTVAYLRTCRGISPVPPDCLDRADVVLVMAGRIGEDTLSLMEHAAQQVPGREMRFVLVGDGMREPQLLRTLSWGVVSVLPRQDADYERIVRTLLDARDGRVELPEDAHGWLAARIRSIQRDVLDPHGLTTAGLYTREVDVLRLLAEGMDTVEIADRLNYSERTVKNIIHGTLSRLKLRNRSHAVAYALRNGVM